MNEQSQKTFDESSELVRCKFGEEINKEKKRGNNKLYNKGPSSTNIMNSYTHFMYTLYVCLYVYMYVCVHVCMFCFNGPSIWNGLLLSCAFNLRRFSTHFDRAGVGRAFE